MIKHLKSNLLQRKTFQLAEINILNFKVFLQSQIILPNTIIMRYLLKELFFTFSQISSPSRIRSVCVFTGRTRGVYKQNFRVNRMFVKEKSSKGFFIGIRKSS
jgi:ribosomal protein S14